MKLKPVSLFVLIVCLAGLAFGYWGAFTRSGNKAYEEMDGIFPFFVLLGSSTLLFVWLIYHIYLFIKNRRNPN